MIASIEKTWIFEIFQRFRRRFPTKFRFTMKFKLKIIESMGRAINKWNLGRWNPVYVGGSGGGRYDSKVRDSCVVAVSRLLIAHFGRRACNALSFVQSYVIPRPAALCGPRVQERTYQRRHLPPFDGSSFNVVSAFTFLRTDKRASRSNLPFHRWYIYSVWSLHTEHGGAIPSAEGTTLRAKNKRHAFWHCSRWNSSASARVFARVMSQCSVVVHRWTKVSGHLSILLR